MKRFDCYYSMYLHHKGVKSIINAENLIDAIKNSNQKAILKTIIDEDGTVYTANEHDIAVNGFFNYYWTDKNGKVIYDQNDEKPKPKPNPIYIGKTTTDSGWIAPNGKFYECELEGHSYLADALIDNDGNRELILEKRNWLKLSSGEIKHNLRRHSKFSRNQKKTILNYFTDKEKIINILGFSFSSDEFDMKF